MSRPRKSSDKLILIMILIFGVVIMFAGVTDSLHPNKHKGSGGNSSKAYTIKSVDIAITPSELGSVTIKEDWTLHFDRGSFSKFEVDDLWSIMKISEKVEKEYTEDTELSIVNSDVTSSRNNNALRVSSMPTRGNINPTVFKWEVPVDAGFGDVRYSVTYRIANAMKLDGNKVIFDKRLLGAQFNKEKESVNIIVRNDGLKRNDSDTTEQVDTDSSKAVAYISYDTSNPKAYSTLETVTFNTGKNNGYLGIVLEYPKEWFNESKIEKVSSGTMEELVEVQTNHNLGKGITKQVNKNSTVEVLREVFRWGFLAILFIVSCISIQFGPKRRHGNVDSGCTSCSSCSSCSSCGGCGGGGAS